jgi:hypothetical protein
MCAVSAVGDNWTPQFEKWKDQLWPHTVPGGPIPVNPGPLFPSGSPPPSREEFNELKDLVLQMKKELEAARAQDIANNEPDCEMEDKVAVLKKIAQMVGVSLENVFPESK